jgi:hypothetical protein
MTLREVVVLTVILAAGVSVAVPVLTRPDRTRRTVCGSNPVRGIHSALVLYSQDNNGYYPGLDSQGQIVNISVEYRFLKLLDANFFTGEYLISPQDKKIEWKRGPLMTANYSYALLDVDAPGQRATEWRDSGNAAAAIVSDRAIDNGSGSIRSIHTRPKPAVDEWRGSIAWNDNHVSFESDQTVATKYGTAVMEQDDLFKASSGDDACMIYSGS